VVRASVFSLLVGLAGFEPATSWPPVPWKLCGLQRYNECEQVKLGMPLPYLRSDWVCRVWRGEVTLTNPLTRRASHPIPLGSTSRSLPFVPGERGDRTALDDGWRCPRPVTDPKAVMDAARRLLRNTSIAVLPRTRRGCAASETDLCGLRGASRLPRLRDGGPVPHGHLGRHERAGTARAPGGHHAWTSSASFLTGGSLHHSAVSTWG
jgi:hypothetical protein